MLVTFLTKLTVEWCKKMGTVRKINTSSYFAAQVTFRLSDIGEGIRDVIVREWYVNVGDKVAQFDNICEVQSDKASVTITSRYDGTILKKYCEVDETILVGQPLVDINTEGGDKETKDEEKVNVLVANIPDEKEPIDAVTSVSEEQESIGKHSEAEFKCIPSVRRLVREHRIDIATIKGTGKNGRILKEDVLKHLQIDDGNIGEEKVPLTGFQKAMVKTMTESLKIPHFIFSEEVKVTKLSLLQSDLFQSENTKLTFMPFFIKATANALIRYPILNAVLDRNCDHIVYNKHINIAVAMDTAMGLAVPVIKDAQKLSITDINNELLRLKVSGKQGKFRPEDLTGGTFSISNIGIIGGTYTKPIILPPQLGIIALGAVQQLPRFDDDGQVVKESVINLSAAADHRIIDGATMARFVQVLKKQIENPNLLFLNL